MKITELRVKNFRCIEDITIPLDDTTVILGENNTGKSAVLDAVRLALPRSGMGGHRLVFSEYDFHMPTRDSDPKTSPGISIELTLAESQPGEWHSDITSALIGILQIEAARYTIHLRVTCKYDATAKDFESIWQFLNVDGQPLQGQASVLRIFLDYVPVFHLAALRDVAEEFSSRSQFWGRLLKSVEIPDDKLQEIQASLEQLNDELLHADPRLDDVTKTLLQIKDVVGQRAQTAVQIRALPLKPWDLMSKSEIALQRHQGDAWFPLNRHGQGVQSLAVLFLFQAFVDHLIETIFQPHSEPILALEEPEAHLHPQAARALWQQVRTLSGQKIVTTHSPYFLQHVPFRSLRLLRRTGVGTRVHWLPRSFSADLPQNTDLDKFCQSHTNKYQYDPLRRKLHAFGQVLEDEYRELLSCYTDAASRLPIHGKLRRLRDDSIDYISDEDLADLETYASRVRGEIFFARSWLLCEGPSEYTLMHRFAEMMGQPLDVNGVSVIDYQLSGSPGAFASLARAFGFPWVMVCDGDRGGTDHIAQIENCGFPRETLRSQITQLPEANLETLLVKNGFRSELMEIAALIGAKPALVENDPGFDAELIEFLLKHKTQAATMLSAKLLETKAGQERVPPLFAKLLEQAVKIADA